MITDEKEESSTLPGKASENDSTKPTNEKKVVVVTPLSKTEYKQSQGQYSSSEEGVKEKEQQSISSKAKGAGKSLRPNYVRRWKRNFIRSLSASGFCW